MAAAEDMLDDGLDVKDASSFHIPNDVQAWLEVGRARGWVIAEGCIAHDGTPFTKAEIAELEALEGRDLDELENEILDRCMPAVRVDLG